MKTLQELNDELDQLREDIHKVKNLIASHPDTIISFFQKFKDYSECKKLIEQVEFVDRASGWTDSRKNPIEWDGFYFKLKSSDELYQLRSGSNWCSEVEDCVSQHTDTDIPLSTLQKHTGPSGYLTNEGIEFISKSEPHIAIACMLRSYIGW